MRWFEEQLRPGDMPDNVVVNLIGDYDDGKVSISIVVNDKTNEMFTKYVDGDGAESEDFMRLFGNKINKIKRMSFYGILSATGLLYDPDTRCFDEYLASYRNRPIVDATTVKGTDAAHDG